MFWDDDDEPDPFAGVHDSDELCRQLLGPDGRHAGRSSHHEAIDVLTRVNGSGELGARFAALVVCTAPRWDRVTGRLIAALQASGILTDGELDALADSLTADGVEFEFPITWVWPQWRGTDISPPGHEGRHRIDDDTLMKETRSIAPPLRRWAARRVLTADPGRYADLLALADRLDPAGRAALLLGLFDAAAALGDDERRRLLRIGLATGMARARVRPAAKPGYPRGCVLHAHTRV